MKRRLVVSTVPQAAYVWDSSQDSTTLDPRTAAVLEVGELFWQGVKDGTYVESDTAIVRAVARLSLADNEARSL